MALFKIEVGTPYDGSLVDSRAGALPSFLLATSNFLDGAGFGERGWPTIMLMSGD